MGRVTILFAGYRSWSHKAFSDVATVPGVRAVHVSTPETANQALTDLSVKAAFFCGWSWIVPNRLVEQVPCYCFHPSPLPKYRGGSPLQHQIIAGETESQATVFRMTDEMDAGPIVADWPLSLAGSMTDIYQGLESAAAFLFEGIAAAVAVGRKVKAWPQVGTPTTYKRRTPAESEITPEELATSTPAQIANKIRSLAHPDYPAAFLRCADGKFLYLTNTTLEDAP